MTLFSLKHLVKWFILPLFELSCLSSGSLRKELWVDNSIEHYKACLATWGFSHKYDIVFIETFSQVVHLTTIWIIFSLDAMHGWSFCQLDVKNAFMYGFFYIEKVYMEQPARYIDL